MSLEIEKCYLHLFAQNRDSGLGDEHLQIWWKEPEKTFFFKSALIYSEPSSLKMFSSLLSRWQPALKADKTIQG